MKSVIERLDDIENTARSIVAKAEEDKSQVEQELQAQRNQFDKELDEKTQAELTRIREDVFNIIKIINTKLCNF